MAFLVRNISGAVVNLPDMGLTLEIGEEYDLTQESSNDVAESVDLPARISAVELVILDPLDNVTPLSTADSLLAVSTASLPNFRIFGGELTQLDDVDLTGIDDTYVLQYDQGSLTWTAQEKDDGTRMRWANSWLETDYKQNDVVRDGAWLMIANTDTSDRAAPQPSGDPTYALDEDPTWVPGANLSVIQSGHLYEFTESVWIQCIRVWAPTLSPTTNYRVLIINETNPAAPLVTVIPAPISFEDEWAIVAANQGVIPAGQKLRVVLDALNSGADTTFTGGWTNNGFSQSTGPSNQGWNRNNQDTVFRIDKDDLDSTDRTSELLSVTPNSTITAVQTNDNTRYTVFETVGEPSDQGTYVEYSVTKVDSNSTIQASETTTITFDVPIPQSTDFVEQPSYWSGNVQDYATITGFLAYDGVSQPGVTDSAFGVDILVQRAYVSEDWDFLASSAVGSSASSSVGVGVGEAPEDGTPYARQDAIWVSTTPKADYDAHVADTAIHFTEASIDHTNILNVGTNTHPQIDAHIGDATIHFTEASIDHTNITNVGTNTHAQIDTHIGDATIHFTEGSIDHTNITNVGTNTHAQIDTHIGDVNNPHSTTVANLTDTTITAPVDDHVLTYDTGEWVNVPAIDLPQPDNITGYAHNGAITQTLGTGFVTLLFNVGVRTNPIFVYAAGEITITEAGWYTIDYDASAVSANNTRRQGEWKLQLNGVDIDGSSAFSYHRNTSQGSTTASGSIQINVAANDVIRLQGRSTAGSIETVAQGVRVTITKG